MSKLLKVALKRLLCAYEYVYACISMKVYWFYTNLFYKDLLHTANRFYITNEAN